MEGHNVHFPECWSDDQRMTVMFAPLRDKTLNPQSWNQKIEFWQKLICDQCRQRGHAIFNQKSLLEQFRRNGKVPACLEVVMHEFMRNGKVRRVSDMQSGSSGWVAWGFQALVKTPVSWMLSSVTSKAPDTTGDLYLVEVIEEKSELLLREHYSQKDPIQDVVEFTVLQNRSSKICQTDAELWLVLQHLQQKGKLAIHKINQKETVVKFAKRLDNKVSTVRESDLYEYKLVQQEILLEKQVNAVFDEIDGYTEKARQFVRVGNKRMALSALKRRKALQTVVDKKLSCLDNIQTLLQKIHDAASDQMLLQAYQAAATVLKDTRKDGSLDKADNVMADLQEVLDDQKDFNDTLGAFESGLSGVTQDELEAELDSILSEDSSPAKISTPGRFGKFSPGKITSPGTSPRNMSSTMRNMSIDQLPDVPTFSPQSVSPARVSTGPLRQANPGYTTSPRPLPQANPGYTTSPGPLPQANHGYTTSPGPLPQANYGYTASPVQHRNSGFSTNPPWADPGYTTSPAHNQPFQPSLRHLPPSQGSSLYSPSNPESPPSSASARRTPVPH